MKTMDYVGNRYGMLVVSEDHGPAKRRLVTVTCDCGTRKTVRLDSVKLGHIRSCGCFAAKESSRRARRVRGRDVVRRDGRAEGVVSAATKQSECTRTVCPNPGEHAHLHSGLLYCRGCAIRINEYAMELDGVDLFPSLNTAARTAADGEGA